MDYKETSDYLALKKLSDLEKYVESDTIGARTKQQLMNPIKAIPHVVAMRKPSLPIDVMNKTIDAGTDELVGHVRARMIILKPQEAMYHAIGKQSKALYELLDGITMTDIIGMIKNKAAVRQYNCPPPMNIAENDVPRHIARMIHFRSVLPSVLTKQALDKGAMDAYRVELKDGSNIKISGKFIEKNKKAIQREINDGVILKIIQLYVNGGDGKDVKSLVKKASISVSDSMYISLLL